MLEGLGCSVTTVDDGAQALVAADAADWDLILMDCNMPEVDGYEATRRIRHMASPVRAVPILALTASAVQGERERCIAAGMSDYLTKPIRQAELAAALARWLPDEQVIGPVEPR
jgi:CheY-like chemotaxis protein